MTEPRTIPDPLPLAAYRPRSELVTDEHIPHTARFPAIDAHTHLGRWLSSWVDRDGEWLVGDVDEWLSATAALNVHAFVNLDGRFGDELEANLDRFDRAHPGRFATFCHPDWSLLSAPTGPDRIAEGLRRSAAAGRRSSSSSPCPRRPPTAAWRACWKTCRATSTTSTHSMASRGRRR